MTTGVRVQAAGRSRLILALDVETLAAARQVLQQVHDVVGTVKVGKELFTSVGPAALDLCREFDLPVFLDLKFHDIPNTVAGAVRAATRHGAAWVSLHTAGGAAMLEAAVQARDETAGATRPKLLGITVLTSLPTLDPEEVVDRALLAQRCGLDGIVASPHDIRRVRQACGPRFAIVTPGVRPAGAERGDQVRVATPGEAIRDGADALVVGRPILGAADPRAAAAAIVAQIAAAEAGAARVDVPDAGSIDARLGRMLEESQALLEGHFVLSSGLHSNRYVQCARLLQNPYAARRAGAWLGERLQPYAPDVVVSVALGGLVIGQEVAAALGIPALFAERDASGALKLRRGFALAPESRAVIVDDVCTRGGSIAECAELVLGLGARVVCTAAIIDRSGGDRAFDAPFEALKVVEARAVPADECELCAAGVPTDKPGSRRS
jgi:orotidine-5'-phosphate decarboxylase